MCEVPYISHIKEVMAFSKVSQTLSVSEKGNEIKLFLTKEMKSSNQRGGERGRAETLS